MKSKGVRLNFTLPPEKSTFPMDRPRTVSLNSGKSKRTRDGPTSFPFEFLPGKGGSREIAPRRDSISDFILSKRENDGNSTTVRPSWKSTEKWLPSQEIRSLPRNCKVFLGNDASFPMVACADFHHSVDRPFCSVCIAARLAWNGDVEVLHFVDNFCVAGSEAVIEPDRKIGPCLWCGFVFHDRRK